MKKSKPMISYAAPDRSATPRSYLYYDKTAGIIPGSEDLEKSRRLQAIIHRRHYLSEQVKEGLHFVYQINGDMVNVAAVFHDDPETAAWLATRMNKIEERAAGLNLLTIIQDS